MFLYDSVNVFWVFHHEEESNAMDEMHLIRTLAEEAQIPHNNVSTLDLPGTR